MLGKERYRYYFYSYMSILFRSNTVINYSAINGESGYPTYDVYNVSISNYGNLSIMIKWNDPEDTKVDNIVLSEWYSTIIVRKIGSPPNNINDGVIILENTIRNQYSDTGYIDSNLIDGNDYYYRFFTYSKTNVLGDGSPTVKITAATIDPILENNDWDIISNTSENGMAESTWSIGDKKYIGNNSVSIIDFNHYDKSDGSGKAGITFMFDQVIMVNVPMGQSSVNNEYWNVCHARSVYMSQILDSFPVKLQNAIKEVKVKSYTRRYYGDSDYIVSSKDKIFLPSSYELNLSYEIDGSKFPIFTNNSSRIRKYNNNSCSYWLRNHTYIGASSSSMPGYKAIDKTGDSDSFYKDYTSSSLGFVPIFNI